MFVGRGAELRTLERLYAKRGFQFPAIYGRRRVGKTSLISEFCKDKPTVFFTAIEGNARTNLRLLSEAIRAYERPDAPLGGAPVYADFHEALRAAFELGRNERVVLVIDEFPYLAKADPSVPSVLQALVDAHKQRSQLFLILCGSSLSFMREQLFDAKSPLYGRRTAQIELKPLGFYESLGFFPGVEPADALAYYAIAGGVPLYLSQFDPTASIAQNVREALLSPSSLLYEEPTNLLLQEVQKAAHFNAVIQAIAEGRSQNNEIATAVGIRTSDLTYYLRELAAIGLVEREMPVIAGSRRAVYRLSDNLFRFWYRFVWPHRTLLERGMPERVLRMVESELPTFCGPVFEDVCVQWLWAMGVAGKLPVEFDDLGRWWGNDPVFREEAEVDIVGVTGGHAVLAAECKWRGERAGADVVETLAHRTGLLMPATDVRRYVFSKGGFTLGADDAAHAAGGFELISFGDMMAVWPKEA